MKKQNAFTLAEVLVTLGIIGVISALTVPTLVKNYQQKAQAVQLRKVITEIESAIDMFITEEGKTRLANTSITSSNGVNTFITSHFKTVKTCSSSKTNECFANEKYLSISGTEKTFTCSGTSYVLANSAAICAKADDGNIEMYIDINGNQPPNIGGRDMFHVYIQQSDGRIYDSISLTSGGSSAHGSHSSHHTSHSTSTPQCTTDSFGTGCFAELQNNNWEMTY